MLMAGRPMSRVGALEGLHARVGGGRGGGGIAQRAQDFGYSEALNPKS